jgi:hypothetical protein
MDLACTHTNCSLGGIAGHAGLFSTAGDVARLVAAFLFPDDSANGTSGFQLVSAATARLFLTEFNQTQSSRALGFNTNDPAAFGAVWKFDIPIFVSIFLVHVSCVTIFPSPSSIYLFISFPRAIATWLRLCCRPRLESDVRQLVGAHGHAHGLHGYDDLTLKAPLFVFGNLSSLACAAGLFLVCGPVLIILYSCRSSFAHSLHLSVQAPCSAPIPTAA